MKLSVIIPCFNASQTIATQLEALAKQEWEKPWEILVVDNGSTDHSLAVLNHYQQKIPHLRIIQATEKQGASYARNVGMRSARGDCFAFCDADDEVAPGWVAAMGRALSEVHVVAGRLDYKKLNPHWLVNDQIKPLEQDLPCYGIPPYLAYGSSCNLGFRRSVYQTVGDWDESLHGAEDTDYCWRIQRAGFHLNFFPEALIFYRLRQAWFDIYLQGYKWSESHVLLRKKYDSLSKSQVRVKHFLGLLKHSLKVFYSLQSRKIFSQWLWDFGWSMGQFIGVLKCLKRHENFPDQYSFSA